MGVVVDILNSVIELALMVFSLHAITMPISEVLILTLDWMSANGPPISGLPSLTCEINEQRTVSFQCRSNAAKQVKPDDKHSSTASGNYHTWVKGEWLYRTWVAAGRWGESESAMRDGTKVGPRKPRWPGVSSSRRYLNTPAASGSWRTSSQKAESRRHSLSSPRSCGRSSEEDSGYAGLERQITTNSPMVIP